MGLWYYTVRPDITSEKTHLNPNAILEVVILLQIAKMAWGNRHMSTQPLNLPKILRELRRDQIFGTKWSIFVKNVSKTTVPDVMNKNYIETKITLYSIWKITWIIKHLITELHEVQLTTKRLMNCKNTFQYQFVQVRSRFSAALDHESRAMHDFRNRILLQHMIQCFKLAEYAVWKEAFLLITKALS